MQLKSISSSNKGLYTVSPAKRVMLSVSQLCKSIVSAASNFHGRRLIPCLSYLILSILSLPIRLDGYVLRPTRLATLSIYLSTLYLAAFAAYSAGVGARKSRV